MKHDRVTKAAARTPQGEAANLSAWRTTPGRVMAFGASLEGEDRAARRRRARRARKLTQLIQNPVTYSQEFSRAELRGMRYSNTNKVAQTLNKVNRRSQKNTGGLSK